MADLLEALLQIKALAGTPARVRKLIDQADPRAWMARRAANERAPAEILAHLAEAEDVFCRSARLILASERPSLPTLARRTPRDRPRALGRNPLRALERFTTRRTETIKVLSACSAAQLERAGVHPVRKLVSLADLVAIMLAHDTDHLGQIMEALGPGHPREDHSSRP